MNTVTAKQLKQRTWEIIRRVRSGERMTITYRGKAVAVIAPPEEEKTEALMVSVAKSHLAFISTMVTWDNLHFENIFPGIVLTPWGIFAIKQSLKTVFQFQIDHIIIVKLAQPGVFGTVEKHASRGNLPVVADLVFCKNLTGRSLIAGKICAPKTGS